MLRIDRIEALIKESGLKKGAFCALMNHGRTWIDDWKRGRSLPNEEDIYTMAIFLHTTPAYLTGETDNPRIFSEDVHKYFELPEGKKNKPTTLGELSKEDLELLEQIRAASPEKKAAILALLKDH